MARIVDLRVYQPNPDNLNNTLQVLPFRLIIAPDREREIVGKVIDIGVAEAFVMIQSGHWQATHDSVFSSKNHRNVLKDATPNGLHLIGPKDLEKDWIDGEPLEDECTVKLEPTAEEPDSDIEVSVRVNRDGFRVKPKDGIAVTGTQKAVLDAIFASAIAKDSHNRLIVASRKVKPRVPRGNA